eukprot:g23520.t1
MVKTRQGWVLVYSLELLAVEAMGGAVSVSGGAEQLRCQRWAERLRCQRWADRRWGGWSSVGGGQSSIGVGVRGAASGRVVSVLAVGGAASAEQRRCRGRRTGVDVGVGGAASAVGGAASAVVRVVSVLGLAERCRQ